MTVRLRGLPPPPVMTMRPMIAPDADLLGWARATWLDAQIAAYDVRGALLDCQETHRRIERGRGWLAQNDGTHRLHAEAQRRVWMLEDRLDGQRAVLRCREVQCWTRCVETHGFRINGGEQSPPPEDLWAELLGDHPPPVIEWVNGCQVVEARIAGVAPWMIDELLTLAERRGVR